jgi:hypothetical protein
MAVLKHAMADGKSTAGRGWKRPAGASEVITASIVRTSLLSEQY